MAVAPHARRVADAVARRVAYRLGYDLVPGGFYSVVPDLDDLGDEPFERLSPLRGIRFDTAAQLGFARRSLEPFIEELASQAVGPWTPDAPSYGAVDGEVLYAMVRYFRPRRVVELGSGSRLI